jgi:8-oxo-dGTP diphosphatase
MIARAKTIDVAAAIIEENGKVLAARRAPGKHLEGLWEFPGGKLEPGESPEDCLKRELFEEFRVEVHVGKFLGESVHDYGIKTIRLLAYRASRLDGDFVLKDHDEIVWLTRAELLDLNWAPADIPLVEAYRALEDTR